jgi:molecular chaperone GrpE
MEKNESQVNRKATQSTGKKTSERKGETQKKRSKSTKSSSRIRIKKLQNEIKALKEEKAQLKDKYFRLAAEYDNTKKLILKETENRIRNQTENLILDILPILDDLERTLDSVTEEEKSHTFINGVQLIRDNMKQILKRYGIIEIESIGTEFNVDLHEALMTAHDEKYPSDYVVQEHQKGYKLNDRVLRPAKVAVNKIDN